MNCSVVTFPFDVLGIDIEQVCRPRAQSVHLEPWLLALREVVNVAPDALHVLEYLHHEVLRQPAVIAGETRHEQRLGGLVDDGAVAEGLRLARRDDLELTGLLHRADSVRAETRDIPIVGIVQHCVGEDGCEVLRGVLLFRNERRAVSGAVVPGEGDVARRALNVALQLDVIVLGSAAGDLLLRLAEWYVCGEGMAGCFF